MLQVIPYVLSILRGRTRPQRASYAIWSMVETVQLISYIASGATTTKWALLVITLNSFIIFGLSLKYGMGGHSRFDILCLLLAATAIVIWQTTNNPVFAVYLTTLAGFIGYLPTIKKAYRWPLTENLLSWGMYVAAATLNVCALTSTKLVIVLPPLAGFILSIITASLLLFPGWKLANLKRTYRLPRAQEA